MSLTNDGKSVRFYGDWNGRCQGYAGAVTATFFKQVPVNGDGTFAGKCPLERASADGTFSFKGSFSGSGAQTRKRADSCDSGLMRWAVRV